MTKNEIIRELTNCNARCIESLSIIYHNRVSGDRYVFCYKRSFDSSLDLFRELAKVLLSLYKLRKYVIAINVVYSCLDFDFVDGPVCRAWCSCNYVHSISDFIKTIKK